MLTVRTHDVPPPNHQLHLMPRAGAVPLESESHLLREKLGVG
jgi:hypothetical protein